MNIPNYISNSYNILNNLEDTNSNISLSCSVSSYNSSNLSNWSYNFSVFNLSVEANTQNASLKVNIICTSLSSTNAS